MSYFLIVLAALLLHEAHQRRTLRHHQMLGHRSIGPLQLELRRRASLQSSPGALFPEPREERVLIWRLLSLTLYRQTLSVGLPAQCDARIDEVGAEESDRLFQARFRIREWPSQPPETLRALLAHSPASWYWGSFHFFG